MRGTTGDGRGCLRTAGGAWGRPGTAGHLWVIYGGGLQPT